MARKNKITVAALNVKTHPHNAETYGRLITAAAESGKLFRMRGHDWATIAAASPIDADPGSGYVGTIYRFLNIDPSEPWLDLMARRPIDLDEEAAPIIPPNLKPNLRTAHFVFLARGHRIFLDARDISPRSACKLFVKAFDAPEIVRQFGPVDVHIETSREAVETLLAVPRISEIKILITKPNPDDLSAQTSRFLERMNRQNVRAIREELKGLRDPGIVADDETKLLMNIALSNGKAEVTGRDSAGARVSRSTVEHPLLHDEAFNETEISHLDKLKEIAHRLMDMLRRQ